MNGPKTVDLTPTWRELMRGLIEVAANGTGEGKGLALRELYKLADFADGAISKDASPLELIASAVRLREMAQKLEARAGEAIAAMDKETPVRALLLDPNFLSGKASSKGGE